MRWHKYPESGHANTCKQGGVGTKCACEPVRGARVEEKPWSSRQKGPQVARRRLAYPGPMPRALITGVTGQDGSYLAELLLDKGYEVHGLIRRASSFNTQRLDPIYRDPHESGVRFFMHYGDLSDSGSLVNLIRELEPDEIYHLGAQSHVKVSFEIPEYTSDATAMGTVRILEAIRSSGVDTRFYQAGSSEMFGSAPPPQNEQTPFHPRSPYGVAKVFAHWMTVNYREAHGLFAANGILMNHESPRRGETFVTRKITRAVARIQAGIQDVLYLGNLDAKRDWGYAPEYVESMWMMLQQDEPDDFVIATGEPHTVRDFAQLAFGHAGLDWERYIELDPRYYRPAEVDHLQGDASKARRVLGWEPKTGFEDLVRLMVDADVKLLEDELSGRLVRQDRDH
jgi:GDPmannose 4,6-dehydratase